MKLMIINPDFGVGKEAMDLRLQILREHVAADVELAMCCLTETKLELGSPLDIVLAGPEIVKLAQQAERESYDAIILYCFSDPALEACRQAVSIPVVGGAQAAYLLVPHLCHQAGVILTDSRRLSEKKLALLTTGLQGERICSFRAVDLQGLDLWSKREEVQAFLLSEAERLVGEGAEAIILGCLSFLGLGKEITRVLQVPVLDPAIAAVSLAESLVRQGLTTSPKAYHRG